jgi:hypothetical protein
MGSGPDGSVTRTPLNPCSMDRSAARPNDTCSPGPQRCRSVADPATPESVLRFTPASQNSRRSHVLRGRNLTDIHPGWPRITHRTVHPMQRSPRETGRRSLTTPSSTQLSTTCARIVGMAEAESLGAGAGDLKVLGRRPAVEARRAVTLASSSLLRKRSRDMSCQCRRVGLS